MEHEHDAMTSRFRIITVCICLATCVLLCSGAPPERIVRTLLSFYKGSRYQFSITESDVKRAPLWDENKTAPPIGPDEALRLARAYLQKTFPESKKWTVEKIICERVGNANQWLYIVEFAPDTEGKVLLWAGRPTIVPVLMNGEIVAARKDIKQ
jgi:hypothetical protein